MLRLHSFAINSNDDETDDWCQDWSLDSQLVTTPYGKACEATCHDIKALSIALHPAYWLHFSSSFLPQLICNSELQSETECTNKLNVK